MTPILLQFVPLLAQVSSIPGLEKLLEFLQAVAILVGIALVVVGAWEVHQGGISRGFLSLIAGFIAIIAIPLVRLMASWSGFSI